jgi:UDP-GlcNAc:undecaprenyl-phosphate GlcNAc-1-phosphate transferase
VLLDVVLVVLAYYGACVLLFGPVAEGEPWDGLLRALPVLLLVKMATFLAAGVYRGLWQYVSIDSLFVYARAVLLSSLACLPVIYYVLGAEGFAPTAAVLDGLVLLILLGGSRLAFRLFRRLLPLRPAGEGRRVLIYGAGDGGELLVRELWNNPGLGCVPVGFADDDPLKKGKRLHGLSVLGGNGALLTICRQHRVEAVYLSSSKISAERVRQIVSECQSAGVEVRRMRIVFEPVGDSSEAER